MMIKDVPFTLSDWENTDAIEHKGQSGTSYWRTFEMGNIRVRMVEYSPGYVSDYYCARGHVLMVLTGTLRIRLKDGREYELSPGMSLQAGDDEDNPHLASTEDGARVFIVD